MDTLKIRQDLISEIDELTPVDSMIAEYCNCRGIMARCRDSKYYRRPSTGAPTDEPTTARLKAMVEGLRVFAIHRLNVQTPTRNPREG
jgi:hypothetical protein